MDIKMNFEILLEIRTLLFMVCMSKERIMLLWKLAFQRPVKPVNPLLKNRNLLIAQCHSGELEHVGKQ